MTFKISIEVILNGKHILLLGHLIKIRLAWTYVKRNANSRKSFVPTLKFCDQLAKTTSRK